MSMDISNENTSTQPKKRRFNLEIDISDAVLIEIFSFFSTYEIILGDVEFTCKRWFQILCGGRKDTQFLFHRFLKEIISKKTVVVRKHLLEKFEKFDPDKFNYAKVVKEFYLEDYSQKDIMPYGFHPKRFDLHSRFRELFSPLVILRNMPNQHFSSSSTRSKERAAKNWRDLQTSIFFLHVAYCQKHNVNKYVYEGKAQIDERIQHISYQINNRGSCGSFSFDKFGNTLDFTFTKNDLLHFVFTSNISRENFDLCWKYIFKKKGILPYYLVRQEKKNARKELEKHVYVVMGENSPAGFFLDFPYCFQQLIQNDKDIIDVIVRQHYIRKFLLDFNKKYEEYYKSMFKLWDRNLENLDRSKRNFLIELKALQKAIENPRLARRSFGRVPEIGEIEQRMKKIKEELTSIEEHIQKEEKRKSDFYSKYNYLREAKLQNIREIHHKSVKTRVKEFVGKYERYLQKGSKNRFHWKEIAKLPDLIESIWDKKSNSLLVGFGTKFSMDEHVVWKGGFTKTEFGTSGENLLIISKPFCSRPNLSTDAVIAGALFAKDNEKNFPIFLKEYSDYVNNFINEVICSPKTVSLDEQVYNDYKNFGNFLVCEDIVSSTVVDKTPSIRVSFGISGFIGGDMTGLKAQSESFQLSNSKQGTYSYYGFGLNYFRKSGEIYDPCLGEGTFWVDEPHRMIFEPDEILAYGPRLAPYILKNEDYLLFLPKIPMIDRRVDLFLHGQDRKIIEFCNHVALLSARKEIERMFLQKRWRDVLKKFRIISEKIAKKKVTLKQLLNFKNKQVQLFLENYYEMKNEFVEFVVQKLEIERTKLIESRGDNVLEEDDIREHNNIIFKNIKILELLLHLLGPIFERMMHIIRKLNKHKDRSGKQRYFHHYYEIKEDFLSFEEVLDVTVDLKIYSKELVPVIFLTESSSLYHNFWISVLPLYLARLPSFFILNQTKEEVINRVVNLLYQRSQKGGSIAPERVLPTVGRLNGGEGEYMSITPHLHTMLAVRSQYQLSQKYDFKREDVLISNELWKNDEGKDEESDFDDSL